MIIRHNILDNLCRNKPKRWGSEVPKSLERILIWCLGDNSRRNNHGGETMTLVKALTLLLLCFSFFYPSWVVLVRCSVQTHLESSQRNRARSNNRNHRCQYSLIALKEPNPIDRGSGAGSNFTISISALLVSDFFSDRNNSQLLHVVVEPAASEQILISVFGETHLCDSEPAHDALEHCAFCSLAIR